MYGTIGKINILAYTSPKRILQMPIPLTSAKKLDEPVWRNPWLDVNRFVPSFSYTISNRFIPGSPVMQNSRPHRYNHSSTFIWARLIFLPPLRSAGTTKLIQVQYELTNLRASYD
ncbi:hypothetical protein AVEN_96974-1 [Araneus ventricosus]|uniref:Uncharacterized protein n=1 Tax=Araneus ventricosus TaxID=182803 RepID=A0A4Y2NPB2_ARAVE|nr:hypothetical protein AVEN_96974-1 [Araneus ventricosus]